MNDNKSRIGKLGWKSAGEKVNVCTELSTASPRQQSKSWALAVCVCVCVCTRVCVCVSQAFYKADFQDLEPRFLQIHFWGLCPWMMCTHLPGPASSGPQITEQKARAGLLLPTTLLVILWGLAYLRQMPGQCFAFYSQQNNAFSPFPTKEFSII